MTQAQLEIEEDYYLKIFDKLEEKEFFEKSEDVWYYRGNLYHVINNRSPYKILNSLLKKHIGKNVNLVHKLFCERVKVYQQNIFYKWGVDAYEMSPKHRWRRNDYYVDNNRNIVKYTNKTEHIKKYKVLSWDFKGEWQYIQKNMWIRSIKRQYTQEYVTVSGQQFIFDKKDYLYRRYRAEQNSKKRKFKRDSNKAKTLEQQHLLKTIVAKRAAEEKAANDIKIIAHGMCPITSFRNVSRT